jgi:hypothetical protein
MTLMDWIKLGIISSDGQAEQFAEDLVDCWHNDQIPGELNDIMGLTPREYQAWTTGGVSLLTIAHWQRTSHPALDASKPWFRISGRPPREVVGYLEERKPSREKKKLALVGK